MSEKLQGNLSQGKIRCIDENETLASNLDAKLYTYIFFFKAYSNRNLNLHETITCVMFDIGLCQFAHYPLKYIDANLPNFAYKLRSLDKYSQLAWIQKTMMLTHLIALACFLLL